MSWDAVLADLSVSLEELERALEEQDWERLGAASFAPPQVAGDMTTEQRARAAVLLERLARTQERVAKGMTEVQQELSDLGARRRGARSYASSDIGGD